MAEATKLPALTELVYYQFSRKGSPTPKLASPLNAYTDVTVTFTSPLLDENSAVVTEGFLLGIRKSNGWTETCYCAAGNLSADGYTATVVRGVDPGGLDYTTGSATFADEHDQDDAVFCNIPALVPALLVSALQGAVATGGSSFVIGIDASGTVTIKRSSGTGTSQGILRWNSGNSKTEYSNDGTTWNSIDSATASNLLIVTASDTTPSNLNAKTASGTGITRTVLNPGGDETLSFSLNLTATPAEINQVATGVSANSTAANLNTLTGGGNADALHTHTNSPDGSYYPLESIIGEAVTASDITNNKNLMYQSTTDGKWYKVTSTTSTWYYRLGILLDSAVLNDTNKRILKQGRYTGKTFANIAPTGFTAAGTGTGQQIGDAVGHSLVAIQVSNLAAAEAIVTAGIVSAKQAGTPAGDLGVYLCLENNVEQSGSKPACYPTATAGNAPLGAIIASATISQALFSGTFSNLAFSFGANVKVPACARFYIVFKLLAAISAVNYYWINTGTNQVLYCDANGTWTNGGGTANYTLTATSTSPIGYSVKAYKGSANGDYDVYGSGLWNRVIGTVLSLNEMFFDAELNNKKQLFTNGTHTTTAGFVSTMTTNFCPNEVVATVAGRLNATTPAAAQRIGSIRGDKLGQTTAGVTGVANLVSGSGTDDFVTGTITTPPVEAYVPISSSTQNIAHCVRLETGFYLFSGYPGGAANIQGNAAGFTSQTFTFALDARQ